MYDRIAIPLVSLLLGAILVLVWRDTIWHLVRRIEGTVVEVKTVPRYSKGSSDRLCRVRVIEKTGDERTLQLLTEACGRIRYGGRITKDGWTRDLLVDGRAREVLVTAGDLVVFVVFTLILAPLAFFGLVGRFLVRV